MTDMLVSVYIPTKNRIALLRRAVESVVQQTYADIELIVVNDGSTDATASYLDELAVKPNVRVIHHAQSAGAPSARNAALRAATGAFVTGLDDDDYFHPQRISRFVTQWNSLTQAGHKFSCLYSQDVIKQPSCETLTVKPPSVDHDELYFYNCIGNQVFTRREYMLAIGLFDEQMPAWQDLDTFIRLAREFGPALLVDEPLYILDLDPRADRISVGSKHRILAAYERLAAKSAQQPKAMRQALYLQVFGPLYGFKIGQGDLKEFFRYGLHVRPFKRLIGLMLRQMLSLSH
jgi:glycosyltransferase involved in cell wall biosynthesis